MREFLKKKKEKRKKKFTQRLKVKYLILKRNLFNVSKFLRTVN